ncbi:MAG: hypothetical protein WCG26_01550 [Chloroflexales bacterium]
MTALLILACSATKRPDAGLLPAIDRYDGPFYKTLRKALRERAGLAERLRVRILSAEYGLIAADTPIPWYDRKMTRLRAEMLYPLVQHELNELRPWPRPRFVSLSDLYHLALPPMELTEYACGGIGARLGQIKAWLWQI